MGQLFIAIADEVFARFPEYVRGVVVAQGVVNGPSPDDLVATLRETEEALRARLTLDQLIEYPEIRAWREAYRAIGIKPSEFRPSVEAMARRVLRGESLPTINALVDIGNVVSLRHLVPVGGHGLDEVTQDIVLRPALGDELFVAFGSDQVERPAPGEFIFVEGQTVLTRRWTWRQANHTLTLPGTTAIEINIDGLPPVGEDEVRAIGHETAALVTRFCGGEAEFGILSRHHARLAWVQGTGA